jgi:hypothetical protein
MTELDPRSCGVHGVERPSAPTVSNQVPFNPSIDRWENEGGSYPLTAAPEIPHRSRTIGSLS